VRDATALQISENQEIQHIKQILGLQHGKNYEDVKALRYGHLMIMTDQVRACLVQQGEWRSSRL
jgi:DNA topoisomerase-2